MKQCSKCNHIKPLTDFYKSQRFGGFNIYCKSCMKIWEGNYKLNNPARFKESAIKRSKTSRIRLKEKVMEAYGGMCSCCGETEIDFLTIDHTKNDGALHRKETGLGNAFYQWLVKKEFPKEGLQILCWNCNCVKRFGKICPHQRNKLQAVGV